MSSPTFARYYMVRRPRAASQNSGDADTHIAAFERRAARTRTRTSGGRATAAPGAQGDTPRSTL